MSDVKLDKQKQLQEEERARFEKASVEAMNIIRNAYDKLMSRQFFYYNIAAQFAVKAVHKSICPTMGVAHKDGVHWLVYNPEFIKYYDYNEISVILEHEICHFTHDHVKHFESNNARKVFKNEEEAADHVRDQKQQAYIHRTKNIATDRSINVRLFGLPNIRMSIEDIKRDFVDQEGNLDVLKYMKHITEQLEKGDYWFKDPNMTLEQADDSTIVEANCITEESFKKILKEADYQPTPELQRLRKEREELTEQYKQEAGKDQPNQSTLDQFKQDIKAKSDEFSKKQAVEIDKVKKYGGWEYYFDLLMSCPKTQEAIQNIKDMDIHFGDDDADGEGGRQAQEARDRIIIEGARNSNKHDIPGDLRDMVRELFDKYSKEEALPWNIILRRMVNASKKSIKKNDVNSRNKYAPGTQILPGYRLDPIKDVAVIWDTSGSCMDDETQTTFIKEVNHMIKAGSNVRVYYCDYDVEHVQDCKDKMMKPGQYEVTGGGGTRLDKGIERAIKDGYKIIIQLSDNYMDFNLTRKDLKGRKIINVSTTDAKQPKHYGPQIHVNRK